MDRKEIEEKKSEFEQLYLTGRYSQKEISQQIGISKQSIVKWVNDLPAVKYSKIRANLAKELDRLSAKPQGNEILIFNYIKHLDLLDSMIRKAKNPPKNSAK